MHRGNIGLRTLRGQAQPMVTDWEAVGINRAGSDLDRLFPDDDPVAARRFAGTAAVYRVALADRFDIGARSLALNRRIACCLRARRTARQDRLAAVPGTWRALEPLAFR